MQSRVKFVSWPSLLNQLVSEVVHEVGVSGTSGLAMLRVNKKVTSIATREQLFSS